MAGVRLIATKSVIPFSVVKPLLKTPPETGRCLAKPKKVDQTFNLNFAKGAHVIFFDAYFLQEVICCQSSM